MVRSKKIALLGTGSGLSDLRRWEIGTFTRLLVIVQASTIRTLHFALNDYQQIVWEYD
jgi:hypothetical protein